MVGLSQPRLHTSDNKLLTTYLLSVYHLPMSDRTLKLATGNWVEGPDFWDRDEDLKLFMERLGEGANLLLVAPRRLRLIC